MKRKKKIGSMVTTHCYESLDECKNKCPFSDRPGIVYAQLTNYTMDTFAIQRGVSQRERLAVLGKGASERGK